MKHPGSFMFSCLLAFLPYFGCSSQTSPENSRTSDAQESSLLPEDQVRLSNDPLKTEIFRDAGLGLFIHWGPNSQMGTEISWPLNKASDEYIEKYYALADTFNPELFDPDEWARLAKLAGIGYIVFTTKHHDGFAMFDTAYSDLKITNTPFDKDITAMVVDAFRKQDILIGFYYSPGDFRYQYETGRRLERLMAADFESTVHFGPLKQSFLDYECGQVTELLTNYGDIFLLWFDGKCDPLKKHAWRLKQDIFIGRGEIRSPEQAVPHKVRDEAWESCMTTSWQWSYQPNPDIRTAREIIENLIRIRARGGNLLLNVGPRPDGRLAERDEELLRELGLFMMLYGEAIRGVRPWKVSNEGDIWFTFQRDEDTVYVFTNLMYGLEGVEGRAGCRLTLKSVRTTPETQVSVLSQEGGCEWTEDVDGLHITVSRIHTIQFIKAPKLIPGVSPERINLPYDWGPDWPIAIKITNIRPNNAE